MAFTEKTSWFVGVHEDGQLELRQTRVIFENGKEFTRSHDRRVLSPGDTLTGFPERVQSIAQLVWTPAVVESWKTKKREVTNVTRPVTR